MSNTHKHQHVSKVDTKPLSDDFTEITITHSCGHVKFYKVILDEESMKDAHVLAKRRCGVCYNESLITMALLKKD